MATKNEGYILLVDDNEDDIDLTLRAIKKSNLLNKVVVAHDGQEALDYLFSEGEFDGQNRELPIVVLLDLSMPRVDGIEVLKRLRNNPLTEILPIVILTTSDEQCDVIDSYKFGANSFVQKPVNVGQFFQAIQELQIYWSVQNISPYQ